MSATTSEQTRTIEDGAAFQPEEMVSLLEALARKADRYESHHSETAALARHAAQSVRSLATAIASLREEINNLHHQLEAVGGPFKIRETLADNASLRERVRVLEGALGYGREAVMESFHYVEDADDQMLADARLQAIDAALAIPVEQSALTKQEA